MCVERRIGDPSAVGTDATGRVDTPKPVLTDAARLTHPYRTRVVEITVTGKEGTSRLSWRDQGD